MSASGLSVPAGLEMTELADRGVISVIGDDASKLLQGVITNDVDRLKAPGDAIHSALLTPQGKLMFEFHVVRTQAGILLETARATAPDLAKRLMLYRLRAKAEIRVLNEDRIVCVYWNGCTPSGGPDIVVYPDLRHSQLGLRAIIPLPRKILDNLESDNRYLTAYHAHRISLGIPEGGKDYDFGDAFPHEANFDLNHGVSFEKGCYVGQEIVARMEHRGTVRKRVVRVTGTGELPATRPDVMMGDVVIGKLGSVAGRQGLALLRLDRAIEAIDKGIAISTTGIVLDVDPEMIARQRRVMAEKKAAT